MPMSGPTGGSRRCSSVDGLIFDFEPSVAEAITELGKPAVSVRRPGPFSSVRSDEPEMARLALEHFTDRGLRHLAMAGRAGEVNSPRLVAFRELVQAAAIELTERLVDTVDDGVDALDALTVTWGDWLAQLPKPVGVLCPQTQTAMEVIYAAGQRGLAVPEQVAVLACGDNDLQRELIEPTLSVVDSGSWRRGWEAARLLDRQFQDPGRPIEESVVPPRGVITCRSTDMLAIDNPDLAKAVRMIRDHACDGGPIGPVLERLPMSRRSIEMGMKRVFGRTIHKEVTRIRIERARELLAYSSMTMPEIASRCGFAYASHLNRIFKERVGMTPTAYRRQFI